MNFKIIRTLLIEKKISAKDLAIQCDISLSGFWKILEQESMKVEVLEKMALAFKVPITVFFDDSALNGTYIMSRNGRTEISYLKQMVDLQAQIIQSKTDAVKLLELRIKDLKKQIQN